MAEYEPRELSLGVIGSVKREADFDTTVDSAVEAGLVEHHRLPRIRCFTGSVATAAVFTAVKAVEGVSSLEFDQPVYAQENQATL